jgi:hypothetical protein
MYWIIYSILLIIGEEIPSIIVAYSQTSNEYLWKLSFYSNNILSVVIFFIGILLIINRNKNINIWIYDTQKGIEKTHLFFIVSGIFLIIIGIIVFLNLLINLWRDINHF